MKTITKLLIGLLTAMPTLAATELENRFASNTISIFFGSELVVGIVALSFFIVVVAFTKLPMPIAAPLYSIAMVIMAAAFPTFRIVAVIIIGILIGAFVFSIWGRR